MRGVMGLFAAYTNATDVFLRVTKARHWEFYSAGDTTRL